MERPRRRGPAAPGAAGLGHRPVGGHVWRQATDLSARLSPAAGRKAKSSRLFSSDWWEQALQRL